RHSAKCAPLTYIVFVLSIIMVSIIGFESVSPASLRAPENRDKHALSLYPRRRISSLHHRLPRVAPIRCSHKRQLLDDNCDGMIFGSGNDRPTPHIVLDILGADPNLDHEFLSPLSLGEG
ncbi:hypothetical protein R3P38DRAFT_2413230, partial [Favolaschia claudopus]